MPCSCSSASLPEVDGTHVPVAPGQTLFDACEAVGIRVPTSCVKQGSCRECLLEIERGAQSLSAPTPPEEHLPAGFRLACQTRVTGEGVVAHTLRRTGLRIETRPTTVVPGAAGEGLGAAVDVGTTTVVVRFVDCATGEVRGTTAFENPQRFGGSDVMARIRYDTDHRGRLLQRTLLGYLARALREGPGRVDTAVVVGNTTMRDLLFGIDVHSVGQRPYRSRTEHELRAGSRTTTSLTMAGRKLRLPVREVFSPPLLGSHVGADAAAAAVALGIGTRDRLDVLVDIGTNTEVVLGTRDRVVCASCPAGPAFEGGGVTWGMPAFDGAIERVRIRDEVASVEVVGGGPAKGICGSGLVDLLAELRRTDLLNAQGRLDDDVDRIDDHGGFPVSGPVLLTDADVNELCQAKGANITGLRLALDAFGATLSDVDRLYLAGGFARHLDVGAARAIGLVPDIDGIEQVGNAALLGACRILVDPAARDAAESLAARIEHIELETHPDFFDSFVDGCQLLPVRP